MRSRDCSMAVPMKSFAEGVHFGRFETSRCFVSRGMFVICRKSLFAAGAYFGDVFRRCVAVFWQAQNFGRVHLHFAWQAQHFRRVACFCISHWQDFMEWRQGADSVAHMAFCAM